MIGVSHRSASPVGFYSKITTKKRWDGAELLLQLMLCVPAESPSFPPWLPRGSSVASSLWMSAARSAPSATRDSRGMEQLCWEERLGELGLFSLGKLQGDLTVAFQYLKELQQRWRETLYKEWKDRMQGMASHCRRVGSDGILGRDCSLGE